MKTAISIPDNIFQAAEELSKRLDMSRSELYAKAVAMFVKGHKSTRVKETLDSIYTTEDSRLDPALMALQALSLPKEEW
jgi:metal-responsive CopG/Arc/MetJ family transcriptional regulator